ncbi:hypothetical protein HDU97_005408 [Phlyctochytrium planicorne]|nr:hypothetical protein HDU97_005408 [Phlyctochytrium planicorne]
MPLVHLLVLALAGCWQAHVARAAPYAITSSNNTGSSMDSLNHLFGRDDQYRIQLSNACSENVMVAGNIKENAVVLSPLQVTVVTTSTQDLSFMVFSESGRVNPRLDTESCGFTPRRTSFQILCDRSTKGEIAVYTEPGNCLEAVDGQAFLYACRNGEDGSLTDSQRWSIVSGRQPGTYAFASKTASAGIPDVCLNQQGRLISCTSLTVGFNIPPATGAAAIKVNDQNLCLDSNNDGQAFFTSCNGGASQQFTLPDPSDVAAEDEEEEQDPDDIVSPLSESDMTGFLNGIESKAEDIISGDNIFDEIDDRLGDLQNERDADSVVFAQLKIKAINILFKKAKSKVDDLASKMDGYDNDVLSEQLSQSISGMEFTILSHLLSHKETFYNCDVKSIDDSVKKGIDCPKVVKADKNCDEATSEDGCRKKYNVGEEGDDGNYLQPREIQFNYINNWNTAKIKELIEKELGIDQKSWEIGDASPIRFIYSEDDVGGLPQPGPGPEPGPGGGGGIQARSKLHYSRSIWRTVPAYTGLRGAVGKRTRDKMDGMEKDMEEPNRLSQITDFATSKTAPDNMDEWDEQVEAAMTTLIGAVEAKSEAEGVIETLDAIKKKFADEKQLIIGMLLMPLELAIPVVGEALATSLMALEAVNSIRTVASISSVLGRVASLSLTDLVGASEFIEFLAEARQMGQMVKRSAKAMSKMFRKTINLIKKGPRAISKKLKAKFKSARKGHSRNQERRKSCNSCRSNPESGSRLAGLQELQQIKDQYFGGFVGRRDLEHELSYILNQTTPISGTAIGFPQLERRARKGAPKDGNPCPFKIKKTEAIKVNSVYEKSCMTMPETVYEEIHKAVGPTHSGFQKSRTYAAMKQQYQAIKGAYRGPLRTMPPIGNCDHMIEAQEWKMFIQDYIAGKTEPEIEKLCSAFPAAEWINVFNTMNMEGVGVGINQLKQQAISLSTWGRTNSFCNYETALSTAIYMRNIATKRHNVAVKLGAIVADWVNQNKNSPFHPLNNFPKLKNFNNRFAEFVDAATIAVQTATLASLTITCREKCVKEMNQPWRRGGWSEASAADIRRFCPEGEKPDRKSANGKRKRCASNADPVADMSNLNIN